MEEIASLIADVIKATTRAPSKKTPSQGCKSKYNINAEAKTAILKRVKNLISRFPVYPQMDLELLKSSFVF